METSRVTFDTPQKCKNPHEAGLINIGKRLDAALDRLILCALGQTVIYPLQGIARKEFPDDAKYPRWVYVLGLSLVAVALFGSYAILLYLAFWLKKH